MNRTSANVITARSIIALRSVVPALLLAVFGHYAPVIGSWHIALWIPLCLTLIEYPAAVYQWLTTKYCFTSKQLTVKRGWLFTENFNVNWIELSTFTVRSNSVERLFHICHVNLGTGVRDDETIELYGVDQSIADQWNELWAARKDEAVDKSESPPINHVRERDGRSIEKTIKTLKFTSLLLLAMSSGSIFVGISALFAVYSFIANILQLPNTTGLMRNVLAQDPDAIVATTVSIIALGFIGGVIVTVIRYYNFESLNTGRSINISSGLVSFNDRTVDIHSICGIEIVQNPMLRIFGKMAVRVVTIDNTGEVSSAVISPISSIVQLRSLARRTGIEFHGSVHGEILRRSGSKTSLYVATVFIAIGGIFAGVFNDVVVAPVSISGVCLCFVLEKLMVSQVRVFEKNSVVIERGVLWKKIDVLPSDSVVMSRLYSFGANKAKINLVTLQLRVSGWKNRIGFGSASLRSVASLWSVGAPDAEQT